MQGRKVKGKVDTRAREAAVQAVARRRGEKESMSIYKISDGCVLCYVSAIHEKFALEAPGVKEYFEEGDEEPTVEPVPPDKVLKINLDGKVIEHTAEDWGRIYDGAARIISQSEW